MQSGWICLCYLDLQGNIHTRQRDYLIWKAEQTHNFALRIANYVMSCWSVQSFFRLQVKKPDWVVDHDPWICHLCYCLNGWMIGICSCFNSGHMFLSLRVRNLLVWQMLVKLCCAFDFVSHQQCTSYLSITLWIYCR